jgi:urease accessory protein
MPHPLHIADSPRRTAPDTFFHPPVRASLHLEFQPDGSGATRLVRTTQEPPLRVVRAFLHPDGSALAHLHNVSGGLLGGDALSLSVDIGAGAEVQLTTTGATRVYRPRLDAPPAMLRNTVRVAENALVEYVPDAIIPFAGSRFFQHTSIELAPGAGLFWWEIVAPGREARGELFAYESFEMRLDLFAAGPLIAAERVQLVPQERAVQSSARLGPFRYWATFYICRVGVPRAEWLRIEQALRRTAKEFQSSGAALWGISTLPIHGLVVRCLAMHGRDAVAGMHVLWNVAKRLLYGRDAVRPRKVN